MNVCLVKDLFLKNDNVDSINKLEDKIAIDIFQVKGETKEIDKNSIKENILIDEELYFYVLDGFKGKVLVSGESVGEELGVLVNIFW